MEEQLNKYFSEYEKLLISKDYSMLSDSERSIANRFSTEEEYNKIRKIILLNSKMVRGEKKTVEPDPEIIENLIKVIKSKKALLGAPGAVGNIFKYRMPAYQFAIYAVASIIIFILIFNRGRIVTVQKPVYVFKTDTIEKYIEKESEPAIQKPAQKNNTIKNEQATLKKETAATNDQMSNENNSSLKNQEILGINVDINENIENSKPKGRSMLDDSSLVKFLVKL